MMVAEETIGQRLTRLRLERGLSQADLARSADIHKTLVSRYERGHTQPGRRTVRDLARALNITERYLREGR